MPAAGEPGCPDRREIDGEKLMFTLPVLIALFVGCFAALGLVYQALLRNDPVHGVDRRRRLPVPPRRNSLMELPVVRRTGIGHGASGFGGVA